MTDGFDTPNPYSDTNIKQAYRQRPITLEAGRGIEVECLVQEMKEIRHLKDVKLRNPYLL